MCILIKNEMFDRSGGAELLVGMKKKHDIELSDDQKCLIRLFNCVSNCIYLI